MVESKEPQTRADVKLILGDQGSGKTNTGVALAKDDYYQQLIGIQSPGGVLTNARCLDREDKIYLERRGIFPNVFQYVKAFSDDGKKSKLIKIPKDYQVISPVRIFANFTLCNLRYVPITLADVIQYLNSDFFTNAWILSDESVMTSARNSMTAVGKLVAMLGAQVRKRNLHFCQMSQYNRMIDWQFKAFATTRILCSYDPKTQIITCDIIEAGKPRRSVSYWAPLYWENFDTEEIPQVPELTLARAFQTIGYTK